MGTSGLVDFHCHLDLYPDHRAAIEECERAGIFTLTVTTTPRAWEQNFRLTKRTKHVRAALGLHPQLVAEHASELALWKQLLDQTRYIGEVGLDAGPQYYRSFELQKSVFRDVLRTCAKAGGKILTVHSTRCAKAVLDLLEEHLPPSRGTVVLHWFTGTKTEAARALELGCYFSVNNAMLLSERHRKMVATLPSDRLLTETDGPFTRVDGRVSKPSDVQLAVAALADLQSRPSDEVALVVRANLKRLLSE